MSKPGLPARHSVNARSETWVEEPRQYSTSTPYFFYVAANRAELEALGRLIDEGEVRPIVDSVLPLARAREAYEPHTHRHRRGKVVLAVD